MTARRLLRTVILPVALAVCGFSGWRLHQALTDPGTAAARARDSALADGRSRIARLNSADPARGGADLDAWLDATTGPLHHEYRRLRDQRAAAPAESGTATTARVTDAALTSLDERAGTARMIATLRIEAAARGGERTADRGRFEAVLARTGDGWKLTSLSAVPVSRPEDAW
ncbi:hypothetical protein [Streptomyces lichenis]|uniref:SnoaL-like domain-containing protein n=1 Tax=Streptomyces lichenis TaxID=2306967 RepID=A0ABT0IH27_9ACTN|nr:hypothetical protein [Streptomyces lichenis]MCK8680635.1 hypothetical protein [Streptomyces lichenis]